MNLVKINKLNSSSPYYSLKSLFENKEMATDGTNYWAFTHRQYDDLNSNGLNGNGAYPLDVDNETIVRPIHDSDGNNEDACTECGGYAGGGSQHAHNQSGS